MKFKFQEGLKEYFRKRYAGPNRIETNVYHVSSLLGDLDELAEKHIKHIEEGQQKSDVDDSSFIHFYFGELLEDETLPKAFNQDRKVLGYKTQASYMKRIECDDYPPLYIVGNADIQAIDHKMRKFIVEQKTANLWSFKKKKKKPVEKHLKQTASYMWFSDAEYGQIWYLSKNNGDSAHHHLNKNNLSYWDVFEEENIETVEDWGRKLRSRAKEVHAKVNERTEIKRVG